MKKFLRNVIQIHEHGGLEVLKYEPVEIPKLGKKELLIKNYCCGVNYIDIYYRTGLYKTKFPKILGEDGSGIVEDIGEEVNEFQKGDRVAYCMFPSYSEYSIVSTDKTVKLPEWISFEQGAASMIQGLTAHYLTKGTYQVKKGDIVLIHAVAGGLGQLLTQVCKYLGATVIGTTSTEEKAKIAKQVGCDHIILYTEKDFEIEVKNLTNGKGVNVVYDSVGKDTFLKSLNCLTRRGFMVSCGNASGPVPPFEPLLLSRKGSLSLCRPTLADYITTREEFLERVYDIFDWIKNGILKFTFQFFPLQNAKEAHQLLEERKSAGKIILIP